MKRALVLVLVLGCGGCSKTARIESLRDDLADNDTAAATKNLPSCADSDTTPNPCLTDLANAFGSKSGYHEDPPDQASAAALAAAIARDGRGSAAGQPDAWIKIIKVSKGPGPDALRHATAQRIAAITKAYAHDVTSDDEARKLLRDVAALPGACNTYAKLGAGVDDATLPLTVQADHSPCVQKDLGRNGGPGGTYGQGLWRAAQGALAFARELTVALAEGEKLMSKAPAVHVALKDFDPIKLKTVDAPPGNNWSEHGTAMPPLVKDAGGQ